MPWSGWRLRWPGGTDRTEIGDGGALSFELRGFSSKTRWDAEDVAAAQRAYLGHRVALDAGGRVLLVFPPGTDTAGAECGAAEELIADCCEELGAAANTQAGRAARPVVPQLVTRQVTAEELEEMRGRLEQFERRYGVPSARMTEVAEFRDDQGELVETDDLLAWSSVYAHYRSLTEPRP